MDSEATMLHFFSGNMQVMSDRKKIFVTGASGLLGGHIVRYFSGFPVQLYGLVRKESNLSYIHDLPVNLVYGDIRDPERLEAQMNGMDAVIHTAAMVGDWGGYEDFYTVNVLGTLNILRAALKNGISSVIITGSVSSYGEEHCMALKDEEWPDNPHYRYFLHRVLPSAMNFYRETKALSTNEAVAFAEKNVMNLTILEPVWIYGENESRSGFYEYLKAVSRGMIAMPGNKSNLFHVIYAKELARAFYLAFEKNLPGIHRIIIGNENPQRLRQIHEQFCIEADLKPPFILPWFLVYPVAFVMEMISVVLKRKKSPLLTRARVNMFYDSICYGTAKAERLLSFRNTVPLAEGIRNTVKWYRENKWL